MGESTQRCFLTRKEAAAYLSERFFPVAFGTLEQHACAGTGPNYVSTGKGGRALYTKADLDSWGANYPKERWKRPEAAAAATT